MRTAIAGVGFAALAITGCSSDAPGTSATTDASSVTGSITVLAASSLTDTFASIGDQFKKLHPGVKITYSFGASSDLATQIGQGNAADVFASASTKTMDQVAKDMGDVQNFATNTMEIAAAPDNPANVKTVQDLAGPGVKVALCDTAVPCGVAAQKVLDSAKVTVKPVSREQDVKSTLAKVEIAEVDAGVVYVTDVKAAGSKVVGVPIPEAVNATTTYPIGVLKDAPNSATATAFEDYVLSAAGQKVLRSAGFAKA